MTNVPETIVTGTCIAASTGATVGAATAILTNAPIKQYAFATGFNCGAFAVTFLMVRETFAASQRKKNPLYGLKDSETRDFDDLMSSTLAGVTTGGLLSAIARGPRGVPSGAVIYGGVCAAGQAVYTAANKWRQDTILRKQREEETGIIANEPKKSFWDYFEMPSWSPIRMISNTEYDDMLDTQLKNLEAEIEELEKLIKQNKKKDP
ncbi:hypothetical protein BCR43DRAFT_524339 [Syncephalastrum racemosum]|uniref:Tim17/Tim22/Tim23/Pmp24 family-domain-containing protein n=1 Tax=Syncephalastrum racemosum TaxID=13706 RepID=A0A1X2HBN7_SYNRA|nr:hypothetical protein BCR43DRAFT_524339 [Syncephalastrum racemosum]